MKNNCYSVQDDRRFKELLDECYFHPSRKYASDEIKFIARNASIPIRNGCENARKHDWPRKRRNHTQRLLAYHRRRNANGSQPNRPSDGRDLGRYRRE